MQLPGFTRIAGKNRLLAACVMLLFLLAACGSSGGTTPTPTPTTAPNASPTTQPTVAATSTSAPAAGFTSYTGQGYTISYPSGWKNTASGKNVAFTDPTGAYNVTIVVSPNPEGVVSPNAIVTTSIDGLKSSLKNPQTVNVPATVTIGGDSWVQKSISGTSSSAGQVGNVQLVVASDNHPANSPSTNSFTIIYTTLQAAFASATSQYFQPMLQSFKFTS